MSSESDDDLLALVDDSDVSEVENERPAKRQRTSSSPSAGGGAAAADDDEDGNDDDSDAGPEIINPYPLEGRYKDAADRKRLQDLPEVERESILFNRSEEMQRFQERQYLAERRRKEQQAAKEASRQGRVRETTGVTSTTKSKLKELKQRRQAREKRLAGGVDDDSGAESGDSEAELGSDVDEDGSDFRRNADSEVEWDEEDEEERRKDQEIGLVDVNRARWGKAMFQKFVHYPEFESVVTGCFVRVNIGFNERRQVPVYRLCQVRTVNDSSRTYTFLGRTVNQRLVVMIAGSERTIEFGICSDSPVTEDEFEYWRQSMGNAGLSLPTKRRIEGKTKEIDEFKRRPLLNEEIQEMVLKRQSLAGAKGANAVIERQVLQLQREQAEEQGDDSVVAEIDDKLQRLSTGRQNSTASTSDSPAFKDQDARLRHVSDRNRRSNVESVRKAEIAERAERRKGGNAMKADPFTRLRTTARVFYSAEAPEAPQVVSSVTDDAKEKETKFENAEHVPLSALDDVIARLDVRVEIEI